MHKLTTVFWDFDGVLMDSNKVRDIGFERVLRAYPKEQLARLMAFHQRNGGLSRYVKFRYFFEEVLQTSVTDAQIAALSAKFSAVMKERLTDKKLLIEETVAYVSQHHQRYAMHVVSGSDQTELRYLCKALGIADYFASIHGSPTPKTELVRQLIRTHGYAPDHCVLIGDSINDFEAAKDNAVSFVAYNNPQLEAHASRSIRDVFAEPVEQ